MRGVKSIYRDFLKSMRCDGFSETLFVIYIAKPHKIDEIQGAGEERSEAY